MSNSNAYQPILPALTEKYRDLSVQDKQELAAAFFDRFKLKDRVSRDICLGNRAPSFEQREFITEQINNRWTAAYVPDEKQEDNELAVSSTHT